MAVRWTDKNLGGVKIVSLVNCFLGKQWHCRFLLGRVFVLQLVVHRVGGSIGTEFDIDRRGGGSGGHNGLERVIMDCGHCLALLK